MRYIVTAGRLHGSNTVDETRTPRSIGVVSSRCFSSGKEEENLGKSATQITLSRAASRTSKVGERPCTKRTLRACTRRQDMWRVQ